MNEKHQHPQGKRVMIAVFGQDRPGIVAAVSGILAGMECNIEDASQTILHERFAGMFVIRPLKALDQTKLVQALEDRFAGQELVFWASAMEEDTAPVSSSPADPFVITTTGPDQVGLVAGISAVLAEHQVNITGLRAKGKTEDASQWVMIYEVDVPGSIDRRGFRQALYDKAKALGQQLSLQHRDIFEAVHRV